jgi:hypothetical protein
MLVAPCFSALPLPLLLSPSKRGGHSLHLLLLLRIHERPTMLSQHAKRGCYAFHLLSQLRFHEKRTLRSRHIIKYLHGRWQVQAGQHGKPKVTGRRSQLLLQSAHAEMRRAGSLAKSEDSASAAATDSEADSITTDGGSHKRKPGSKKGAQARLSLQTTSTGVRNRKL